MYLTHFQMTEKPFSLTPDTQFFLNVRSHRDALSTLRFALHDGEGFIKIVGEVGTGKTLLCRILLAQLDKNRFVTAYIPNPCLMPEELKAFIAAEIGADYQRAMPAHELTAAIYRRLLQIARQHKHVVLVVDEAQAMPRETLEALRLLSNLETEKRKLLQVVLLGQPELDELLRRQDLRQLKQRIVFAEKLRPFDTRGVSAYIQHRLRASGCTQEKKHFSPVAIWLLARASGGIPRLINILAHKSLLCAYGKRDHTIAGWHVAKAVRDTPECTSSGRFWCRLWGLNGRVFLPRPAEVVR
jgi:MSHA biogenesis protein MshM